MHEMPASVVGRKKQAEQLADKPCFLRKWGLQSVGEDSLFEQFDHDILWREIYLFQ